MRERTRSGAIGPHMPASQGSCCEAQCSSCPPALGLDQHEPHHSPALASRSTLHQSHSRMLIFESPLECPLGSRSNGACLHDSQQQSARHNEGHQQTHNPCTAPLPGTGTSTPGTIIPQSRLTASSSDPHLSQDCSDMPDSSLPNHAMGPMQARNASCAAQLCPPDSFPPQVLRYVPCTQPIPIQRRQSNCLIELSPSSFQVNFLSAVQVPTMPTAHSEAGSDCHAADAWPGPAESHAATAGQQHSSVAAMPCSSSPALDQTLLRLQNHAGLSHAAAAPTEGRHASRWAAACSHSDAAHGTCSPPIHDQQAEAAVVEHASSMR